MHYYPSYTKEQILDLTQSQISILIQMIGYCENPSELKKLKKPKFASEFEFEQYLLHQYRLR